MNPGPVMTSSTVKNALVRNDLCHRDMAFSSLMSRLKEKALRVFNAGSHNKVAFITGSGTAAMETTLSSCAPRNGKVLIVSNGTFGDRLIEIAKCLDINFKELQFPWGRPVDPQSIERALEEDSEISQVYCVYHETSTGILNPAIEIGKICRERNLMFILDAISALGGEEFHFDSFGADVCFSSSNKCLHAISGVAMICVSAKMQKFLKKNPPRSFYLNLGRHLSQLEENNQTPYTPAVNTFSALEAALDELLLQGLSSRWERYKSLNSRILYAMMEMGFIPFTDPLNKSNSVNIFYLPKDLSFDTFFMRMKQEGFVIYGCKGHLNNRAFMVANMGELSDSMIDNFIVAVSKTLGNYSEESQRVNWRSAVSEEKHNISMSELA